MTSAVTYLDHNATSPIRASAALAVAEALQVGGNPSSVHAAGRVARRWVEAARAEVAALVGARPSHVVFVSGGSEANSLALRASGCARVLVGATEHDSARAVVPQAETIPVLPNGIVDLDALRAMLARDDGRALVCLMLANNETGVLQPVAEAAAMVRAAGGLLHCDAVQAAGKIPVVMTSLGADLLSLSAHKLGGPMGTGALVVGARVTLAAQSVGGGQEQGRRAGTENLPGIAGFGAAAKDAGVELADGGLARTLAAWRDDLEARVRRAAPEAILFGADAPRLPNTSCIALPGVPSETQVMALDLAGVMVSAGAACSSGKVRPSHVLGAMGASPDLARSAIRVSLGRTTTAQDIDRFIDAWTTLRHRARGRSDRSGADLSAA